MNGGHSVPIRPTTAERAYGAAGATFFRLAWLAAWLMRAGRDELAARTGVMPDAGQPLVWFHGASAGEMAAAVQLATLLRGGGYRFTAAYTAANRAGIGFVARRKELTDVAAFVPWDAPRWVARALDHWRPRVLVLVETELWPRLVLEACRRHVPVFFASARIYPRDVPGYRAIRRWIAPTLGRFSGVLAQDETERARLIALGAAPDRCLAAGNLKYLGTRVGTGRDASLRAELGLRSDERVVVFGSIHADEIGTVFAALERLRVANARFIIAPRHASAGAAIARESARRRWVAWGRREARPGDWRVLVLDTMGELTRAYGIAAVAVVGGGFAQHGGHNLFEPLECGAPTIFGPHVQHFESEARALTGVTPGAQVGSAAELRERLAEWLADDGRRERILALQRQALPDAAAMAARYLAALSPWLDGCRE